MSTGYAQTDLAEDAGFDDAALREAFGRFATGITVVSGMDGEDPIGFTCQSFHSLSMQPPLVSIGVMASSTSYPRLRRSGNFCVNVLAADQASIALRFARRGADRWSGVASERSPFGNPVLAAAVIAFDCRIVDELVVGDHLLVVGEVHGIVGGHAAAEPLVYFRSRFRELAE